MPSAKRLKTTPDSLDADLRACAPVMFANVGDWFKHHTFDANHANWDDDLFEYLGRATGKTKTPNDWLVFRHAGFGRGICARGSTAGLNGGMLDAIGAWPLRDYRMYDSKGDYDEDEIALPPSMCWGFRVFECPSSEEEEA